VYVHTQTQPLRSPIKPNRAKKARSFRRLNRRKQKYPAWAKLCFLMRRIFWPKPGIFIRRGSLWALGNDPKIFPGSPGAPLRGAAAVSVGAQAGLWRRFQAGGCWLVAGGNLAFAHQQARFPGSQASPCLGPFRLLRRNGVEQAGSQTSSTPLRLRPARDTPNSKRALKGMPPPAGGRFKCGCSARTHRQAAGKGKGRK
jgi:hypothetical protein